METKSCKTYRDLAWNTMSSHWNEGVVMTLIIILCASIGSGISMAGIQLKMFQLSMFGTSVSFVVAVLLVAPLSMAFAQVLLGFIRQPSDNSDGLGAMVKTATNNYTNFVVTFFLMYLVLLGLAIITLGIGTIIFSIAYSIVPFVLKDHPDLSPKEVLYKSRMLMRGHKVELFILGLSFVGWWLVGILTCGIAFLWIAPYYKTAIAHFYEDIKA